MKQIAVFSFLSIVLFASACNKTETLDPPSSKTKKIITLIIDDSYATSQTDNWLLLHDINGSLI
jgi:hypothetical protein